MSILDELKAAAEAVKAMDYPWEHIVRDARIGQTSAEYALLAHPSNVLGLIYDREALDEWMDLCERRAQRMIALSTELDAARTEIEALRKALTTIREESHDIGACECAADALIDLQKVKS